MAAQDDTWIPGREFTLRVKVTEAGEADASSSGTDLSGLLNEETKPRVGALGYDATVLLRSSKKVVTQGGVPVKYTIGIKNAGTEVWTTRRVGLPDLMLATSGADLVHSSWLSSSLFSVPL